MEMSRNAIGSHHAGHIRSAFLMVLPLLCLPLALRGQERMRLPEADRPVRSGIEEVFTIGGFEGDDWESFSQIGSVAFDAQGNLYVLDVGNYQVVKVSPQGVFVSFVGRQGGGPGEFGIPVSFSVTRSGEVRVLDLARRGFTVFDPDGSPQRTVSPRDGSFDLKGLDLLPYPDGRVLSFPGSRVIMTGAGQPEDADTRPLRLYDLGEELKFTTLYRGWDPRTTSGPGSVQTTAGGGIRLSSVPTLKAFDPGMAVGVFPDGRIALTDSTTYEVKILGREGEVERILTRPFSPREVTARDREAERERRMGELMASGAPRMRLAAPGGGQMIPPEQARAVAEARVESMEFATEIPVISGMGVDWSGRIWIRRSGDRVGEEGPIDLLSPDGGYLGTLAPGNPSLPAAFGPDGLVAYLDRDEMDAPLVMVWRLTLPEPSRE